MIVNPKLKFISALLLLLIYLLYSNWLILDEQRIPKTFELGHDKISRFGKGLEGLPELLPEDVDRLGFVTDNPMLLDRADIKKYKTGDPRSPERLYFKKMLEGRRDYVISQYHLTPLLIFPGSEERFVLLILKSPDSDYRSFVPDNYKLVKDLGEGKMLFEVDHK